VARPDTTPFAEAVYARLAPIAADDEALDWPLLRFIVALSEMFAKVEAVARSGDGRVPYSRMVDVTVCPAFALPFLAQFVGVRLRPLRTGETASDWAIYARDAITRRGGRNRGRPDAMLSAVEETLAGLRSARLLERAGGDAYALTLVTRPGETPDAAATVAAALTQKPAGIVLTHTITDYVLIDEGTRTINAATGTIDAAALADVT
jgi:hypothetical protein